jgi:Serine hydrolase (FSH1)
MRHPDGRITKDHPLTFDFAIMVGGFRSDSAMHTDLYASIDSYQLPSVHIIGRSDRVVPSADSFMLADQFKAPIILEHPGGHIIPGTPHIRDQVASFLHGRARG